MFRAISILRSWTVQAVEYVMLIRGDSDDIYTIGKLVAFQIQNLLSAYKEKYDKENFIKNVLLDNMLLVDIYNKAKKLHIDAEERRLVFVIETNRQRDNQCHGSGEEPYLPADMGIILQRWMKRILSL